MKESLLSRCAGFNFSERIKMMKVAFRLCLAMVICTASLQAQAAVTVRGKRSCGEWVKNRQAKNWPGTADEAWLVGFLSGLSAATDKDVLKDADNPSLFLWMDNYCKSNPLMTVTDGAANLYYELLKPKKK
jgi:hypothetical protein